MSLNLSGKWVLKDFDSGNVKKGYSGFQLLEINGSTAEFYIGFSLDKKSSNLKVLSNKIVTSENVDFAAYELVNINMIRLFINSKSNGETAVFACDFYRLEPTYTDLKKEEIVKMTFLWPDIKRESLLIFNNELLDKETLAIMNQKKGINNILEQIDSTFFVSIYCNGKRTYSIPIKEVNNEFLKLYAIPTGPMEIIAYRKN